MVPFCVSIISVVPVAEEKSSSVVLVNRYTKFVSVGNVVVAVELLSGIERYTVPTVPVSSVFQTLLKISLSVGAPVAVQAVIPASLFAQVMNERSAP